MTAGPGLPRLVVVSDYAYSTGGIEQFVLALLEHSRGHYNRSIISWTSDVLAPSDVERVVPQLGDIRAVWDELDRADIVVTVTSFNVRLLALLSLEYVQRSTTPLVSILHTSGHSSPDARVSTIQNHWLASLSSASFATVAVSHDVARSLGALASVHAIAPRIEIIENASRLPPHRPNRHHPRPTRTIAFIGRPGSQKGFDLYLRLAEELSADGVRFCANTVSIPTALASSGIEFSDNLNDGDLLRFYNEADLLVAPYRRADGLPLALLEALNCGVPVVGFEAPGVGDLLRRHNQAVIEPTYEALATFVGRWLADEITLEGPSPGQVDSWAQACQSYLQIFDEARASRASV